MASGPAGRAAVFPSGSPEGDCRPAGVVAALTSGVDTGVGER